MDQDITSPERAPKGSTQATGRLGCILAAAGATLLAATKLTAAFGATAWAFSKLFGFPDSVMWVIMAISLVPVLWATIWTAGRAWHVERRLEAGLDVDAPVFKLMHYWR